MRRSDFLKLLAFAPLTAVAMNLKDLNRVTTSLVSTDKMPALFLGHGSPMNAIDENEFVRGFRDIAKTIPTPRAILCVSAHWETNGTYVTAMAQPKTIHDFGGFPRALYEVQYPAPGSPKVAEEVKRQIHKTDVLLDNDQWGLDHGAWSVIKHLYPNAEIPVLQLSLDRNKTPQYHYELAKELYALRKKGILIIGSGNMVHNLGMVAWNRMNEVGYAFDWAQEASQAMRQCILSKDHGRLTSYQSQGKAFQLAVPTPEHFLPLLYALALQDEKDEISLFNDKALAGSLTMTSVRIG
jgi:4,5-DOPA dioxygenase extradiol